MSAAVACRILDVLESTGFQVQHLAVREFPASDLVHCRREHPRIRAACDLIEQAQGVVVATPIYQTSYSGLLKVFLDILHRDALSGKAVLPVATAGTLAHHLGLEYGLIPILHALGATCTKGLFLIQEAFEQPGLESPDNANYRLKRDAMEKVDKVATQFAAALVDGGRGR